MNNETNPGNGAALYFCRLSLERCRVYLAHLCACVHGDARGENVLDIIAGLERELHVSQSLLAPRKKDG